MDNLTIKVENDQLLVSSLEVAENFGKNHNHVLRDINNLTVQNWTVKPMFYETTYTNSRGKQYPMYLMNRDGFSLLVMGFTGSKALEWKLKYINAFNEMENKLKNQVQPRLPKTYKEALLELVAQVEAREKLEAENAELKPKALFADAISESKGCTTIGALAKMLAQNGVVIGQNRLYEWLRENGYVVKDGRNKNVATQRYVEQGLFELKENLTFENGEPVIRKPTTLVTGKGQKYFINKFLKGLKF